MNFHLSQNHTVPVRVLSVEDDPKFRAAAPEPTRLNDWYVATATVTVVAAQSKEAVK
jgi:hypothetical protein